MSPLTGRARAALSVFKLPLAVAVLKDVEEGKLRLDQKVRVKPEEVAPGAKANTSCGASRSSSRYRTIGLSISRSDNTSSDKLLELVAAPAVDRQDARARLTEDRHQGVGSRVRGGRKRHPNTGRPKTSRGCSCCCKKARRCRAAALGADGAMSARRRFETPARRLPPGTPVADKTGTGDSGKVTNDVGLITLPAGAAASRWPSSSAGRSSRPRRRRSSSPNSPRRYDATPPGPCKLPDLTFPASGIAPAPS